MPDDLEEVFERAHRRLAEHRARVQGVRRALASGRRSQGLWADVGLDWQVLAGPTLDHAERMLDGVESRFDQLEEAPPRRPDGSPTQKAPASPGPPAEPAKSLWDRLSDAEDAPLVSPSEGSQPASRAEEGGSVEPGPWWAPHAVYAGALTLVLALLGWALYSVP